MQERKRPRRVALLEGVGAGLALALADALATGVQRTPWRMLALVLGFGLVVGTAAGLAGSLARRRGVALALVVAAGGLLDVLSLASKELPGNATALGIAAPLACLACLPCLFLRAEQRGAPVSFVLLAAVPGGSLLVGLLGASVLTLSAAALLPLVVGAALLTPLFAKSPLPRIVAALAAGVLLALPVLSRDSEEPRRDRNLAAPDAPAEDAPDVLLVIVDTLRADAVPTDGDTLYARMAREGVRFDQCISTAPWTLPSVASILTSQLPSQHGATRTGRPLPLDVTTLAEVFAGAGYRTAAFTGGAFLSPAFRLDQGFERFDARAELGFRPFVLHVPLAWRVAKNRYVPLRPLVRWMREYPGVSGVREAATAWYAERDRGRPAFLLVHTYEAHDYYLYHPAVDDSFLDEIGSPGARFAERLSVHPGELLDARQEDLDWFEQVYSRRIAHVGRELGALVETIERNGERDLVVALVSDHGEGWDAGRRRVHHGGRLHDDLLRVPLFVLAPGRVPAGAVREEQVSTLDVMPMLLDLAGIPAPAGLAGTSPFSTEDGAPPRVAWSEERASGADLYSLRSDGWKMVRDGAGPELGFDLAADPLEDFPRDDAPAPLPELLRSFVELFPARAVDDTELDQATRAHLEAIGYL